MTTFSFADQPSTNIKSDDRILVLKPLVEGKGAKASGIVDPQLFTGGNQLHAIHDTRRRMWTLKYEKGGIPEPLKQQWTKFSDLRKAVERYFLSRNIQIIEIIE